MDPCRTLPAGELLVTGGDRMIDYLIKLDWLKPAGELLVTGGDDRRLCVHETLLTN